MHADPFVWFPLPGPEAEQRILIQPWHCQTQSEDGKAHKCLRLTEKDNITKVMSATADPPAGSVLSQLLKSGGDSGGAEGARGCNGP
jgi:hypothetical protein